MTDTNVTIAANQAVLAGLKKAIVKTRGEVRTVGLDPFMRFKTGDWIYGSENIDVQEGSMWAVDPTSFAFGFTCWTKYPEAQKRKNDNLGKVVVPIGSDPIDPTTLDRHVDADGLNGGNPWPWVQCIEVKMKCISGEDEGVVVLYSTNSAGGVKLLNAYLTELQDHLEDGKLVAIVKLGGEHYPHKLHGRVHNPLFEYVEWRTLTDAAPVEEPTAVEDEATGDAPASTRTRHAPAADEAKPAGRTRRRPAA